MKITILLVVISLGFASFAQKKPAVKNNSFTEKLRYNTLPALTEVQDYKSYHLSISDASGRQIGFDGAQGSEVNSAGYLPYAHTGKSTADFYIEVKALTTTPGKVDLQTATSQSATPITTYYYAINYTTSYRVMVRDNKTNTVLIDSVFKGKSAVHYPTTFDGSSQTSQKGLESRYAQDKAAPDFTDRLNHAAFKQFSQKELKNTLTSLVAQDWTNIVLIFAQVKTKDPFYARLDTAQTNIESALKIINKSNLTGAKINWHMNEVKPLLQSAYDTYVFYSLCPEIEQIEEVDVKRKLQMDLTQSIYYLDIMLGKFDQAKRLLAAAEGLDYNDQMNQDTLQMQGNLKSAFQSLKTTDGQYMLSAMKLMEFVLYHEEKWYDKHKVFYKFEW